MPLQIVRNDITKMHVDAIVNAANESLLGGGGVDGAIHRAAGPELLAECRALNGCRVGEAKVTKGYKLPCKYVIHTVGPVWHGGKQNEKQLLSSCYKESLHLAAEMECESVAFPLISAGAYGYPQEEAMRVAMDAAREFLETHDMTVYIVVFTRETVKIGESLFDAVQSYIDDHYVDAHYDPVRENMRRFRNADALSCEEAAQPASSNETYTEDTALPDVSSDAEENEYPAPMCAADHPKSGYFGAPKSSSKDLWELIEQVDESFAEMLLRKIDERQMTDAQCYKRANIDRRVFSKIRNNPNYHPGKQTVLAFAVSLRLTLSETREMLEKAGFALSHSNKADIAVEYFITHGIYNIFEINEVLFRLDMPLLGG